MKANNLVDDKYFGCEKRITTQQCIQFPPLLPSPGITI